MHSRDGCYTYAKEIIKGESYITLSEEEKEAIKKAMTVEEEIKHSTLLTRKMKHLISIKSEMSASVESRNDSIITGCKSINHDSYPR